MPLLQSLAPFTLASVYRPASLSTILQHSWKKMKGNSRMSIYEGSSFKRSRISPVLNVLKVEPALAPSPRHSGALPHAS